jgi:hypothetical protein
MTVTELPNATTITTINGHTAFCYTPMHNDKKEISFENVFTNSLNVLGSIPYISIISGLARAIFATIMSYQTKNAEAQAHYEDHFWRACVEVIGGGSPVPLVGNIICLWFDVANASLQLKIAIEYHIDTPKVLNTKNIYQI